jgi:hypothetical protein
MLFPAALAATVASCTNVGSDRGLGLETRQIVRVELYLDRDGTRTVTTFDTAFASARVSLIVQGVGDTLATATSNTAGIAEFLSVPLGRYRLAVNPQSIGDSIRVEAIQDADLRPTDEIRVTVADSVTAMLVRLGYPEVSIREIRSLPLGRRVFLRAYVLSGVQSFRDTTSHVADSSGQLRLTRVTLRGGLTGNNPGDSVSILGVTSTRAGQPTLDQALLTRFGQQPAPVPFAVSTETAATAAGGTLDAALAQITGAIITDTATVAPDFRIRVTDGSDTLSVILDGLLSVPRTVFAPGRSMNVRGVLVPDGLGAWVLKPRIPGDITLN